MDIVVGDIDGAPMILKNHGVAGRHWVSFELAGTESNRLAIGARMKLVAGGMTQSGEIQSGGSYLSQNDLRLHFGLGAATKIDRVEIFWRQNGYSNRTGWRPVLFPLGGFRCRSRHARSPRFTCEGEAHAPSQCTRRAARSLMLIPDYSILFVLCNRASAGGDFL